jgi:uncharacterized membrane protein
MAILPFYTITVGPLGNKGTGNQGATITNLLAAAISTAFIVAGIILLFMILFSGIEWLTAGSDTNKVQNAQKRLTNAVVGFVILVAARVILYFMATQLGVGWLSTLRFAWPTLP